MALADPPAGAPPGACPDAHEEGLRREAEALRAELRVLEEERLQAEQRGSAVEAQMAGGMERLQDATQELTVWIEAMGTLQVELESVIMRGEHVREQIRARERECEAVHGQLCELEAALPTRATSLAELGTVLQQLEAHAAERRAAGGVFKGLGLWGRRAAAGRNAGAAGGGSAPVDGRLSPSSSTWSAGSGDVGGADGGLASPGGSGDWEHVGGGGG